MISTSDKCCEGNKEPELWCGDWVSCAPLQRGDTDSHHKEGLPTLAMLRAESRGLVRSEVKKLQFPANRASLLSELSLVNQWPDFLRTDMNNRKGGAATGDRNDTVI